MMAEWKTCEQGCPHVLCILKGTPDALKRPCYDIRQEAEEKLAEKDKELKETNDKLNRLEKYVMNKFGVAMAEIMKDH